MTDSPKTEMEQCRVDWEGDTNERREQAAIPADSGLRSARYFRNGACRIFQMFLYNGGKGGIK